MKTLSDELYKQFSDFLEAQSGIVLGANKQYLVINGYPVVLSFAKEANTETFERIRDILLATSYTKKAS